MRCTGYCYDHRLQAQAQSLLAEAQTPTSALRPLASPEGAPSSWSMHLIRTGESRECAKSRGSRLLESHLSTRARVLPLEALSSTSAPVTCMPWPAHPVHCWSLVYMLRTSHPAPLEAAGTRCRQLVLPVAAATASACHRTAVGAALVAATLARRSIEEFKLGFELPCQALHAVHHWVEGAFRQQLPQRRRGHPQHVTKRGERLQGRGPQAQGRIVVSRRRATQPSSAQPS